MHTFETTCNGKWILAGEHAVMRAHPALLFPDQTHALNLMFEESTDFNIHADGEYPDKVEAACLKALEQAWHILALPIDTLCGQFQLTYDLPIGYGLGFSAALCVAIGRWLCAENHLAEADLLSFCTQLEDCFHGKSSGADVAAVLHAQPIVYAQAKPIEPFQSAWQPNIKLSDTGIRARTDHCIQIVADLWTSNPKHAQNIDQRMHESVKHATQALSSKTSNSLDELATAIQTAHDCFQDWGLISDPMRQQIEALREQGALACKPTGAGLGGMLLSLWEYG